MTSATAKPDDPKGIAALRLTVTKTWMEPPTSAGGKPGSFIAFRLDYGTAVNGAIPCEGDLASLKPGDVLKVTK